MASSVPDLTDPSEPVCALCGAPVAADVERCGECGFHLIAARPAPLSARALWALAGLVAVVYSIALVVVAMAR